MSARIYVGDLTHSRDIALQTAFDYVGLYKELSSPSKIFVKPNFTFPRPMPGVTTSKELLEPVLRLLSETGAEVFVGESNGGYGSFLASEAFAGHGLEELCRATGSQPLDLSQQDLQDYSGSIGGTKTTVSLPRILVEEIDFTISIPVLKVHVMTTVSLSLKNLWGCYPSDMRLLEHKEIERKLALISKLTKSRFGIVDGFFGLDEHGPMEGTPRFLGKFIAGNDLLALDFACARMMGFKPQRVRHLRKLAYFLYGSCELPRVDSNEDLEQYNWSFRVQRNFIDNLTLACFHSNLLAKIVFDSPLTPPIYSILGRRPRRKLA